MHRPLTCLAINFLLILLSVNAMNKISAIDDFNDTSSFHCGKKLFLAKTIRDTIGVATSMKAKSSPSRFRGNFDPPVRGLLLWWPLPAQDRLAPSLYKTYSSFQVVFRDHDHKVLGVVMIHQNNEFVYCRPANAGGVITSISPPDGGFDCNGFFLSTSTAIKGAKAERLRLQKTKNHLIMKYPLEYKGDLKFEGLEPHQLLPVNFLNGNFNRNAKNFLVLDYNLNVVGALYLDKDKPIRCSQVERTGLPTMPELNSIDDVRKWLLDEEVD